MTTRLLYMAARLPCRSETFVYREVLGLRERGVPVAVAGVHAPDTGLGDRRLDAIAAETVTVYADGSARLIVDALLEAALHPGRFLATLKWVAHDWAFGRNLGPAQRGKLLYQCLAALALARRARPLGVGHIHAHFAHVPTTIAMYAARQLGISFSFTGHANDLFVRRVLLPEKLRRARFVACISHWHRHFYRQWARLPDERFPIIRCGVDLPVASARILPRSRLQLLAVGRLVSKKGLDVLIRAMALLRRRHPEISCRIIGEGPERERLAALIRELEVGDLVELAGPRPNAEVRALLAESDVFVLPCRCDRTGDRDGIPVVLMEAMAAGVPVVSGDLPAIRELVRPGETGLLVPPDSPQALADALDTLLRDGSYRRRLGAAGRDWVEQEFSLQRNLDRLLHAFGSVGAMPGDRSSRIGKRPAPAAWKETVS